MKASEEVKGEPFKKRISLEDLIEDVLLSSSSSSSADHQQQFNLAAVYFHRHDFYKSLLILADLFLHINSIQALHVRLRICFLYLETILRIKSAIEIMFSSAENEDFLQTAQKIFSTLHEIRDDIKTSSSSSSSLLRSMIDFRVYLYKCRVFSLLRNHMRSCRREIKNAMELFQHELRPCLENDTSSSSESLKELTQSGAFSSSLENQNQLALILKANLEYQRSNYRKALKLLTSSHLKDQDIYMGQNNVACIYFKMGKYPAAALFFHESLQLLNAANKSTEENAVGAEENGEEEFRMVATLKQSYTVDVVYNYALALQHSDRPREALTMFQSISTSYLSSKIMLWLRMGECAIAIHHQSEAKLAASVGSFRFVGNGKHRRLLVDSAPSKDSDESSQLLRDAVIYLSNALFLLSSHQKQSGNFSDGPTERMEPGGDVAGDVVPAPIEQETDVCEVLSFDEVETFIHLLLAYGNLGLKNFAVAHRFASVVLLKDGTVLKASDRELAYTYLCEAQVGMGAASEVDIDTLAMDATNGSNRITKLSLKAMVQVARGDLEGALRTYSQACSFAPTDATIVKGLIYTYLRLGKTREARLLSEKLCAL